MIKKKIFLQVKKKVLQKNPPESIDTSANTLAPHLKVRYPNRPNFASTRCLIHGSVNMNIVISFVVVYSSLRDI